MCSCFTSSSARVKLLLFNSYCIVWMCCNRSKIKVQLLRELLFQYKISVSRRCLERSDRCVMTLIIDVRLHCYENERGSQIFCTGKRLHPAVLTRQIKQASTIQALVCTYSSQESHLNCIHVSACWIAFDKLARQSAERTGLWKNANALQPLVQCTVQAARTEDIGARALANIAYGAARSGRQ